MYLGHSPIHVSSVALVFNPVTGLVSPAYHVVFDDNFSTVPYMQNASVPPMWEQLVQTSSELYSYFRGFSFDRYLVEEYERGEYRTPADGWD